MTEQGQISWTKLDKHNMVMKRSSSIDFIKVLNIGLIAR